MASQTEPDHLDSALSIMEALVPLCVRGTAGPGNKRCQEGLVPALSSPTQFCTDAKLAGAHREIKADWLGLRTQRQWKERK